MWICNQCGRTTEDLEKYHEACAETCLQTFYQPLLETTCRCGGDFVEATKCKWCGEWISDEDYLLCECCVDDEYTVDNALEIGDINRQNVGINGFVAWAFTADQINHILEKWVNENVINGSSDVKKYLDEDKSDFIDHIIEKREGK